MIYIWFFLNKKSYTGCEGLLGAIYKQLKSKIIISNKCMDVSANVWKNTQTVTLISEETDKQEPPRNHQGSSLWGTGNCWTPASCPQWSQFHHELRGCRPKNMFPLQNEIYKYMDNTRRPRLNYLATMTRGMFGGAKMRSLNLRTLHQLLSMVSMVVVASSSAAALLPVVPVYCIKWLE